MSYMLVVWPHRLSDIICVTNFEVCDNAQKTLASVLASLMYDNPDALSFEYDCAQAGLCACDICSI